MDATRISDGKVVAIKRTNADTSEISIAVYISSDNGSADLPENHCVQVLDRFTDPELPDFTFLVMPLLRRLNDPPFVFVDEVLDFVQQTLEVRDFLPSI